MSRGTKEFADAIRHLVITGHRACFEVGVIERVYADSYEVTSKIGMLHITRTLTTKLAFGMEVLYMYTIDTKTKQLVGNSAIILGSL